MDLGLKGRVALVGGSSKGLGRAIAATLAREGCRVALNGRDAGRLKTARRFIEELSTHDVEDFVADVSDPAEVQSLVERVRERFGSLDVLVCNAGGPPPVSFRDAPPESWQAAIDLNLRSTIELCRHAVPIMHKRQWGRIICVTSVAAKQPMAGLILSTTARAGVLGFAKSLADQLAPDGITVNVVCPGWMHTERVEQLVGDRARREDEEEAAIIGRLTAEIPVGRMGEPDELAAAVAFLASQHAGYITGVALQVDGGFIRSIL